MPKRLLFLILLIHAPVARADLQWSATHISTTAAPSDGVATAQFVFTNTGAYPIKVIGTHTSCGCTAAVSDEHPVGPGQTGKIEVTFKTLNRHGLYKEPIIIDTNDPNAKQSTVFLRILLRNPVEVLPTLLFWQQGEPLAAKVIRITVTEGFNLKSLERHLPESIRPTPSRHHQTRHRLQTDRHPEDPASQSHDFHYSRH